MTQKERIAIARIFRDLINADSVIAAEEMEYYDSITDRYALHSTDEAAAIGMTLAEAVMIASKMSALSRRRLLDACKEMTVSDGFCDRTEALVMMGLLYCVSENHVDYATMISVPKQTLSIEESTALYVESRHDESLNNEIVKDYRSIHRELLSVGFEFIYVPYVINHYKETQDDLFKKVLRYISPKRDESEIETLMQSLRQITTAEFVQDVLCNKLGMASLCNASPSLLIKISENYIKGTVFSNYLRIEIDRGFKDLIIDFVDVFASMQHDASCKVFYPKEEKGQFLYHGFYKQLLDIYVTRTNVRSRVILDFLNGEILLPDINSAIRGMHRKEKAFYALVMLEGHKSHICFNLPRTQQDLIQFETMIRELQHKYGVIYEKFGGRREDAPNIGNPEIRSPILSKIKKCINAIGNDLYHLKDYHISKDEQGGLTITLPSDLKHFKDFSNYKEQPISKFNFDKI